MGDVPHWAHKRPPCGGQSPVEAVLQVGGELVQHGALVLWADGRGAACVQGCQLETSCIRAVRQPQVWQQQLRQALHP